MEKDESVVPRLPLPGEYVPGFGVLIMIEDQEPPPPETFKDFIFEEVSARVELRRNGKVLDVVETRSDLGMREVSVENAILDAKELASEDGITPESEVEIVVVRITECRRYKVSSRAPQRWNDKQFQTFEQLAYGSAYNVPEEAESVVWSSRNPASVSGA